MRHIGDEVTLRSAFEMSFFHWIPALLWTAITPLIPKMYARFQIKGDQIWRSMVIHVVISVLLVLLLRVLALGIDFSIKHVIGLMDAPVLAVLKSVVWVIPASTFKEILFYWIAIIAIKLILENSTAGQSTITVSGEHGLVPLPVNSIYWLESNKNYIDIHSEKEKYRLRHSMSTIEDELDSDVFLRIHRSYIVNKSMIKTLKHWRRGEYLITLKNQKILTSSRSFNQNIKQLLQA